MSTVKAESHAVIALRDYLLRTLPAKVASINAERVAKLKAARAGPYVIGAGRTLLLGAKGSEVAVPLTQGAARTAAEVAQDIVTAAVPNITASADAQGRLLITSTAAPAANAPSSVSVGSDANAAVDINTAFGWPMGGTHVVRNAIVAPDSAAVCDGNPGFFDLGRCFWVLIMARNAIPRPNIRADTYDCDLSLQVLAAEPSGQREAAPNYMEDVLRCIREVIHEDRTLDAQVFLAQLPNTQFSPDTFTFSNLAASPLVTQAAMTVRVSVFERN